MSCVAEISRGAHGRGGGETTNVATLGSKIHHYGYDQVTLRRYIAR